jgi:hypothetical protein
MEKDYLIRLYKLFEEKDTCILPVEHVLVELCISKRKLRAIVHNIRKKCGNINCAFFKMTESTVALSGEFWCYGYTRCLIVDLVALKKLIEGGMV